MCQTMDRIGVATRQEEEVALSVHLLSNVCFCLQVIDTEHCVTSG